MTVTTDFSIIDPLSFQGGHPHAVYDMLREREPVWRHPGSATQQPFWALTRFEDIRSVSLDADNFTSTRGFRVPTDSAVAMDPQIIQVLARFMLAMDNPEHQQFRALVASNFMPGALGRAEPRIRASVDALIAGLRGRGEVDVVTEVAAIVPIKTVCAIMGVPEEDEWRVFEFTNAVFGIDDPEYSPSIEAANAHYLAIFDYAWDMLERRRREPKDDVLTLIANATIDGRTLTEIEQKSFFSNMISAGNETTRSSLAGAIWGLARNPDQRRLLVDDPALIPGAINEILRWFSPVFQMARTAKRDIEVGGTMVREGERVALLYGAGNHDPAVFSDPHRMDLRRENAQRHLAFGYGVHHCIGSRLATLQLRMILEAFLTQFPDYVVTVEPRFIVSNLVQAMKALSVDLRG